jgi:hypothetical protein
MVTLPGVARVNRMNRNPPWKPPVSRPAAVGRKLSGPPTPASPRDSSEAGAPGDAVTAVRERVG